MQRYILVFLCVLLLTSITAQHLTHEEVAAKVSPAVVGINCVLVDKQEGSRPNILNYYGTGVFISADGLLLTNLTVVPKIPYSVTLYLADGRIVSASCVDIYPEFEMTVLKADGTNFPYIPLADSAKASIGDSVYTFGNPFHSIENDTQVAASHGTVSGVYRVTNNVEEESQYNNLVIETNAALNPGSDGGPLTNHRGELLGILSLAMQKERRMGTAIPVHLMLENLMELSSFTLQPYEPDQTNEKRQIAQKGLTYAETIVSLQVVRKTGQQNAQRQRNRKAIIMQRPQSWATATVIENGEYILASAYQVTSDQGEGQVEKIIVHTAKDKVEAKIVSIHKPYDIALLRPETPIKCTQYFSFGSDKELRIGEWIGVCGKLQSSFSITCDIGIVSTLQRNLNLVQVYQTQAFINYANSGGPVINKEGKLLGIATHVYPNAVWGLNSGVSMFTGIDTIKSILPQLKKGSATQNPSLPFLGVSFWQDKKVPQGALISTVTANSAAHKAGVLPGDILISLDEVSVGEWADLVRLITSKKIGQKIEFEVIRENKKKKLTATLGKRPW
ncbi:S1C family serine protease [Candidatus Uabimicrobium amorphum]|uniref:Serine protease MucD n=1 Tax=Uabimicrobium amorphum TaxID=2596890 RepID=A0A5S9F338_UABAM|nr:trypsin-like peptidase domain-containing protein [Candidatus Uabimicrobium amorphum]BBM84335.1 serine protease MucD [Candidatus Uabimicrobium amorphum]